MIRKPATQDRALRALAEGADPTMELLADASKRSLARLRARALREGWKTGSIRLENVHARIRPIVAKLLDKVEALSRKAGEEEGRIDRTEIDGVVAMIRVLDKIAEFARPEEAAKNRQIQRDEDLAAILGRINERIVQLARELAAQMVAERDRKSRSRPAQA